MTQCFETDPDARPSFEDLLNLLQTAKLQDWQR
jgi:hypothetical protein